MPGGFVCSASVKGPAESTDAREVLFGDRPLRKLFTKEQRAFCADQRRRVWRSTISPLLGPIFVLKLKYAPEGFGRPVVAEMWLYPDGSRILELSTKCLPNEGFQVAAETPRVPLRARHQPRR